MTRNTRIITLCFVALGTVSAVGAAERHIHRSQLPPAVEKTVQEQSQGATIKGFSVDTENGQKVYEAEMVVNGHTKDIEIAEDGTLNEIEEEVSMDSLPTVTQDALHARAGAAKIVKVESLTKKGRLVAYEAATLKGSKKGEIQVGPNGEKLSREE